MESNSGRAEDAPLMPTYSGPNACFGFNPSPPSSSGAIQRFVDWFGVVQSS